MKKIISITIIALLIFVVGCKKENLYPSKTVKASYPVLTLLGDELVPLAQGATFTDPGATYTDSVTGESGTVTATETLNTNEEGITILNYTFRNKNGFETTITRTIAITGISDAFDISGDYERTSNGEIAHVTKIAKGLFQTDDVGGNVYDDPALFLITSDSSMIVPSQYLVNSEAPADFEDVSISYDPTVTFQYVVISAGYGTATRVFVKQ